MNEEEKELINNIERALNLSEVKGDLVTIIYNYIVKATINLINKLQKELEQEKEENKKINLENQALFESINCNDDNMLARRYQKLQKENEELKDYHDRTKHTIKIAKMHRKENEILKKVIDLMAKPITGLALYDFIRKEYFTLENEDEVKKYFYKKVEEENVKD